MSDKAQSETTHFGFRDVPREAKEGLVKGVFNKVASNYDLMNDLMSAGMHRLWKRTMVESIELPCDAQVLDVAGGTGDISFQIMRKAEKNGLSANITVCDINDSMLEEGRSRAINHNRLSGFEWICGNAQSLPFESNRFDIYTIAFGIRNVTDIPAALKEAYRVLKPGGRFYCLEFSKVNQDVLARLYRAYSFGIIPRVGKLVVGDASPYQYLVESIAKFPPQDAFAQMLKDAGFYSVKYENMTGGVVALHSGYKT